MSESDAFEYLYEGALEHRAQQEVGVRGPLQSLDLVQARPHPALTNGYTAIYIMQRAKRVVNEKSPGEAEEQ